MTTPPCSHSGVCDDTRESLSEIRFSLPPCTHCSLRSPLLAALVSLCSPCHSLSGNKITGTGLAGLAAWLATNPALTKLK